MTLTRDLRLDPADPRTAPESTLRAFADHLDRMREERVPQDPPMDKDTAIIEFRHVQDDEDVMHWYLWDADRIVAHVGLFLPLKENTHLGWSGLEVEAAYRGRGLGRELLGHVVDALTERGRTRLVGVTSDRIPSGIAFAERLGAEPALPMRISQLDLASLDRDLLRGWAARGEANTEGYVLWINDGAYPEDRLQDIADVTNVMNTAPRGTLDMEDWQSTPERLRQWEAQLAATGERRVSAFVEHVATRTLVGYSELFWLPSRATIVHQGATGVHPDHRRHGLGRWLKAANLLRVLDLNPEGRFVRTGNANVNEGMLAINVAMGFEPFMARVEWQISVDDARRALGR